MGVLDHWHPVLRAQELGDRPRTVELHGHDIVVFRTGDGRLGALDAACPHRGMALVRGRVRAARLECPYHGWAFAPDGAGTCPASPRRVLSARAWHVVELHGAVWIAGPPAGASAPPRFPSAPASSDLLAGVLRRRVHAPLALVVDNFTEVEHTPYVHDIFGYTAHAMPQVEVDVELTDTAVRVVNRGPQKPVPRLIQHAFGVYPGDVFVDEWTTRFSPVHTVYDQRWEDPVTGDERPERLRLSVFYTPVDDDITDLFVFLNPSGPRYFNPIKAALLKPLFMRVARREIELDARVLDALADKSPDIRGRRLGRFDKALVAQRERISRIYEGQDTPLG